MTTPAQNYRKVWLPTEVREAIKDYADRNDTKPSPLIAQIVQQIVDDPKQYGGADVPAAGPNYISAYVNPALWEQGMEAVAPYGVHLGSVIRVELRRRLAADGVPWEATSVRPKNVRIPILE
jgi:hypothetical protein